MKDDFKNIIEKTLKRKKVRVEKIPTGWTNYVFLDYVESEKSFIFRFPRNDFFAKTLIKEEVFCKYIKNKISFRIPDIKLFYNNGRPFTMHKYIEGKTLTECCNSLTENEKKQLGKDISFLIYELQKIRAENLKLPLLSEFLEGLSKVDSQSYDLEKHDILKQLEAKNPILSHADFNPGNVLLDSKNKMFAVLDFAFVSYTSDIVDISRIVGRLPRNYYNVLLTEYENYFNKKVDRKEIDEVIDLWNYVEQKYIAYMRKCHPDVILPT